MIKKLYRCIIGFYSQGLRLVQLRSVKSYTFITNHFELLTNPVKSSNTALNGFLDTIEPKVSYSSNKIYNASNVKSCVQFMDFTKEPQTYMVKSYKIKCPAQRI